MAEDFEKPYVIGLDMGGTNSVFGVVDQRGTIKAQTVISSKAYPDVNDYVKAAVEALQPALKMLLIWPGEVLYLLLLFLRRH